MTWHEHCRRSSEHNQQCRQFTPLANTRATLSTWLIYALPSNVGVRPGFTNGAGPTHRVKKHNVLQPDNPGVVRTLVRIVRTSVYSTAASFDANRIK